MLFRVRRPWARIVVALLIVVVSYGLLFLWVPLGMVYDDEGLPVPWVLAIGMWTQLAVGVAALLFTVGASVFYMWRELARPDAESG